MARPLQDGNPPAPVESFPNDGTRELSLDTIEPAFFCEDFDPSPARHWDSRTLPANPFCHGYQEPRTRRTAPSLGRTHCSFPVVFRPDHTVYADRRSMGGEHPPDEQPDIAGLANRVEVRMMRNGGVPREQPDQEQLAREIGARLRRVGDEINTIYLQRAIEQENERVPLLWHLYQFISDVLAVFFNPQVDLMP